MIIRNYTAHEIKIIKKSSVTYSEKHRKHIATKPELVCSIPTAGALSVHYRNRKSALDGLPLVTKEVKRVDPVPMGVDVAIVSAQYINASDDPRCYGVTNMVYTEDGKRVIGCLALTKHVR